VVVAGTIDLVLGAPPARRSSVCVVEVRAGGPDGAGAGGRRLLALLETLRSGAPPCRAATYDARSGRLDAEEPTDDQLAEMVREVAACAVARCLDRAGAAA
jgi:hypothetical protein